MKSTAFFLITFLFMILAGPGAGFAITAEDLKAAMDRKDEVTLIDIRNPADYGKGHIPGAINVPAKISRLKPFPPVGRVILYGDGLDEAAARAAADAFNEKEGIRAEVLIGGYRDGRRSTIPRPGVKG